jgi:hypothetical protein
MSTNDREWETAESLLQRLSVPDPTRRRELKALIGEVRQILLRDWDPIGVGANLADEYDFILGKVMAGLSETPDPSRIAALLAQIERDDLCLSTPQQAACDAAAKSLTALRLATDRWPVTGAV